MTSLRMRRFGSDEWSEAFFESDELGTLLLRRLVGEIRLMQETFEPSFHVQLREEGDEEWSELHEWEG